MKAHRFWILSLVAALAACTNDNPTGLSHVEVIDGVVINRVDDLGMAVALNHLTSDDLMVCDIIDFEEFAHGDLDPDPITITVAKATLPLTPEDVDIHFAITAWTDDAPNDIGTGKVVIFNTGSTPNGIDDDLRDAGLSVDPSLGNVAAHQSGQTPEIPNDADVISTMQFTFPAGPWVVKNFTALDQEGPDGEHIGLLIDVSTDGTLVGKTDITVDNADKVEVVDIDPDAGFSTTLDFDFDGSGAIDNIEVCRIVTRGGEGCTPGYWKQEQHFGNWPVSTGHLFGEAFAGFCEGGSANLRKPEDTETDICGITLLAALNLKGGGINALGRHAAAAWLNAGSTVDFKYLQFEVENDVNHALGTGEYEATKNQLADANEAGCPLALAPLL